MTVYGPDMGGVPPGVQTPLRAGILDLLGNPASCIGAYSFRLLRVGYVGPTAIVYRTGDTSGKYLYPMPNGTIDYQTIRRYGTNDSLGVTFFDQAAVNGNQVLGSQFASISPKVMRAGALQTYNGRIVANYNGSDCSGRVPVSLSNFTRVTVARWDNTASGQNICSDGVDNALFFNAAGSLAMYGGSAAAFKTGLTNGSAGVAIEVRNGASSVGIYNGVSSAALNPGILAMDSFSMGGSVTALGVMTGSGALSLMEHFMFNTNALSAAQLALLYTNAQQYYGIPA